jgi:hypothetical protein
MRQLQPSMLLLDQGECHRSIPRHWYRQHTSVHLSNRDPCRPHPYKWYWAEDKLHSFLAILLVEYCCIARYCELVYLDSYRYHQLHSEVESCRLPNDPNMPPYCRDATALGEWHNRIHLEMHCKVQDQDSIERSKDICDYLCRQLSHWYNREMDRTLCL